MVVIFEVRVPVYTKCVLLFVTTVLEVIGNASGTEGADCLRDIVCIIARRECVRACVRLRVLWL